MVGKELSDQVRELAQIQAEEGYMADWEKRGADTFVLHEHNCAIRQVADCCPQTCSYELELFRRVLDDVEAVSEEHMMREGRACSYIIRGSR